MKRIKKIIQCKMNLKSNKTLLMNSIKFINKINHKILLINFIIKKEILRKIYKHMLILFKIFMTLLTISIKTNNKFMKPTLMNILYNKKFIKISNRWATIYLEMILDLIITNKFKRTLDIQMNSTNLILMIIKIIGRMKIGKKIKNIMNKISKMLKEFGIRMLRKTSMNRVRNYRILKCNNNG